MKSCYTIQLTNVSIAIADLFEFNDGMMIARINVPVNFRNRKIGSALLNSITSDADFYHVPLYLAINPYGDMTYDQLESWYNRYGFKKINEYLYKRSNKNHAHV